MEKPILIIVTIVVLLLVGIIVLAFFTGGLTNFNNIFTSWYTSSTERARCQADCAQACLTAPAGSAQTVPTCANIQPCICGSSGGALGGGTTILAPGAECGITISGTCPTGQTCRADSKSTTGLRCK